jgi:hypothetical protein
MQQQHLQQDRPEKNAIKRQKLQLQPQHKAAILTYSDTHHKGGFIQTRDSGKLNQPSPHVITVNRNQPFGFVSQKGDGKTTNEPEENDPKEISGLQTRPKFGSTAHPHRSEHQKQRLNAIKQELSTSGSHMLGDGLQNNQQQQYSTVSSIQQSATHYQATSSENIQQNEIRAGEPRYAWRDIGPGLEISSNAPRLAGGPQHNLATARQPRTEDVTKEEQDSTTPGHGNAGGQGDAVGQVSDFDHANALGHSANFGYRDALLSLPAQLQTRGTRAYEIQPVGFSQGHESVLDKEGAQYRTSGHNIQNSPQGAVRSGENIGAVFPRTNVSPGTAGAAMKGLRQHSQQQQHSHTNSLLPQAAHALHSKPHDVLLKPNNGLMQGIPGSLILGNELHAGYDSRNSGTQNMILSTQGMVNTGGHVIPLQVFYLPVSSPHIAHLGDHQTQTGTLDQTQLSVPTIEGSHIGKGTINTAANPYIGLTNRGLYGYTGIAGLPVLQGYFLGVQGMQGVVGGATLQSGHAGGTHLGSNHPSLFSDAPAPDNNLAQEVYKSAFQTRLQAAGQQQKSDAQAEGNQQTLLRAGQDALSFQSAIPYQYQHQQTTKQHTLAPQVRVHPNGLGLRLLQHHPIPYKSINFGGFQRMPVGGHYLQHPSSFPAQHHVGAIPNRGHQTLSHMHQPISQQYTSKFDPLPAATGTRISSQEVQQPQAVVKRNERVSTLTALPETESAEGRPKRYFGSKPLMTAPLTNSPFTTNSHYATGMRHRNFGPGFIRK